MTNSDAPLTFGSLFAGIGGIDLGFERAGWRCAWQVELDDYAQAVLHKHWPDVPKFRDVRDCGAHNLEPVDMIAGGFPCQDISQAGKREGITGERSGLFYELIRIVREMGPKYVLLENVAALLHRGMGAVLGEMASCGYDAEWDCIPAAAVGAPHLRDRVFIVGTAQGGVSGVELDGGLRFFRQRHGEQHQEPRPSVARDDGTPQLVADAESEMQIHKHASSAAELAFKGLQTSTRGSCSDDGGGWLPEPDVGRVADGVPSRVDRLRCLGNAVVPQVVEPIARRLAEVINGRE